MSARSLSLHFDGQGKVPVKIPDVLAWINAHLIDARIDIRGVDASPDQTKGVIGSFIQQVEPRHGSAIKPWTHHVIAYSTQQPMDMQRLVVCKEMLHVFDQPELRTWNQQQMIELAEGLMNPGVPVSTNAAVLADSISRYNAVSVLFPYGYWEVCFKAVKAGEMTVDQVAEILEIPASYVHVTMTDGWRSMRETFLSL